MITFLGDIALLTPKAISHYKPDCDYVANFEYVFRNKDIEPTPNKINISSPNIDFKSVFGNNPIVLGVANNHILDYGIEGFESTIIAIQSIGIQTVGDKPFWYKGETCILAYTCFFGEWQNKNIVQFKTDKAKKEIEEAKTCGAKNIIVYIHWGIENYPLADENQKKIGHWLIDQGVSIVIGHHSHCIQPIEEYKGHYIVYSLGNCVFPPFNIESHFDENGIPHRKYRFNWRKWNNKGLALVYDEVNGKLVRIDELYFKNNTLRCTRQNASLKKYIALNQNKVRLARLRLSLRKYWLFLVSNSFVDGKVFDIKALKAEIRK